MPALRTIGIVMLTALAVSIGLLGYAYIRAVFDERVARDAALEVGDACQTVINVGGQQVVEVTLPGNYTMRFVENQIVVDGYCTPEQGLIKRFAKNSPELGPGGHHTISISLGDDDRLVVTRI